jgi:hypothetical protein
MTSTMVRIRSTMANGEPRLTFSVDGNPALDQMLNVMPDKPPVDAFLQMHSNPNQPTTVIETTGSALLDDLRQHKNLDPALNNTINSLLGSPDRGVHIEIHSVARIAHNMPWEALHDATHGFLALASGIPFTRIVQPARPEARRTGAVFDGRLRIVAVIAASGIPGHPEWDALRVALSSWSGELACKVLVDDAALRDAVNGAGLAGVAAELVPKTASDLVQAIDAFTPHFVHLFCHGQSASGGILEIANAGTAFGGPPIYLTPVDLAPALRSSWLVILNACSTGQAHAAANTSSFACTLVEQGVPFVTSMLQDIPAGDAHRFAQAFLGKALADLKAQVAKGTPFVLAFSQALVVSRNNIAGGNPILPARVKEWTFPILCAAPTEFTIRPVASMDGADHQQATATAAQIRLLTQFLIDDDLTAQQRLRIEKRIALLEAELTSGAGD